MGKSVFRGDIEFYDGIIKKSLSSEIQRIDTKLGQALCQGYEGSVGSEISIEVNSSNVISGTLVNGSISTEKFADNAVTDRKIGNGAVTEIKLHQSIIDKFAQLQEQITRLQQDREQILRDSFLNAHPVNTAIIAYKNFDPNTIGGTWVLEKAGYALWTTEGTDAVGTKNANGTINTTGTIEAGLPNIAGAFEIAGHVRNGHAHAGAFKVIPANWSSNEGARNDGGYGVFNAKLGECGTQTVNDWDEANRVKYQNNVYGKSNTVQPPAVKIRLWRRTA